LRASSWKERALSGWRVNFFETLSNRIAIASGPEFISDGKAEKVRCPYVNGSAYYTVTGWISQWEQFCPELPLVQSENRKDAKRKDL